MAWFKADDQLPFHPKVLAAGNAAMGLWIRAGTWSSSQLTDGFIPIAIASAMANECDADALVDANLWDRVDGGYQFHDWSDFQPSAEEEREKREARKRAGRKGAAARWGDKRNGKSHSKPHDTPDGTADGKTMPRSRPRPNHSSTKSEGAKRARALPDDWTPSEDHRTLAAQRGVDCDLEASKMRDWATDKGATGKDWDARFRNWLHRAEPPRGSQQRPNRDAASRDALVQAHFDMQQTGGMP